MRVLIVAVVLLAFGIGAGPAVQAAPLPGAAAGSVVVKRVHRKPRKRRHKHHRHKHHRKVVIIIEDQKQQNPKPA
jgi:hypothetical protein